MKSVLSIKDIETIQNSWQIPSKTPTESGVAILTSFFEKFPENRKYFSAFKDMPLDQLKTDKGFRAHAIRVVVVIADSVKVLSHDNYIEKLEEIWTKIGESHRTRNIQYSSFIQLQEVILNIIGTVCLLNEEEKLSWKHFIDINYDFLFKQLKSTSN